MTMLSNQTCNFVHFGKKGVFSKVGKGDYYFLQLAISCNKRRVLQNFHKKYGIVEKAIHRKP